MRTTLVPGLLMQIAYNLNRGNTDVRLFEAGHVYAMQGEQVDEHNSLAFVSTGAAQPRAFMASPGPLTFFHLKGDIEQLACGLRRCRCDVDIAVLPTWSASGRAPCAVLTSRGQDRRRSSDSFIPKSPPPRKLKQDIFVAEVFVEALYELALRQPAYTPVSKYPAVERDFSFVLPDGVEFESIRQRLASLAIGELAEIIPAETFRGGSLAPGTYSFLLRVRFQSAERTLRDDEVANWSQQIVKAVESLGGALRQ